jgi:hypothetical protein
VVQPYEDAACATPKSGSLTTGDGWVDGGCIASFGFYKYTTPTIAEPATCMANPVMPMGTVDVSEPITFCCVMN